MKWVCVSLESEKTSSKLLSEYMNSQGFVNEVIESKINYPSEFKPFIDELDSDLHLVRVSSGLGRYLEGDWPHSDLLPRQVGAGDFLKKTEGHWWIKNISLHGCKYILQGLKVDSSDSVLISGSQSNGLIACHNMVQMGFKTISFTAPGTESGEALVEELKRRYFGVSFHFVLYEQLSLLPESYSFFVNTLMENEDNRQKFIEMSHFNFLCDGGYVWDFQLLPSKSNSLKNATKKN